MGSFPLRSGLVVLDLKGLGGLEAFVVRDYDAIAALDAAQHFHRAGIAPPNRYIALLSGCSVLADNEGPAPAGRGNERPVRKLERRRGLAEEDLDREGLAAP